MTGKFFEKMKRLIVAMLIMALMMTSVSGYVPMWASAFAEGEADEAGAGETASREEASAPQPPKATEAPKPTEKPTEKPTAEPTEKPTAEPTEKPTAEPTEKPTAEPTEKPTAEPTEKPTAEPTEEPTAEPTEVPAEEPTEVPAEGLTEEPTEVPAEEPAEVPAEEPTEEPAEVPAEEPTEEPTEAPAEEPTGEPTESSSVEPSAEPSAEPSIGPEGEGATGEEVPEGTPVDPATEELSGETVEPGVSEAPAQAEQGTDLMLSAPVLGMAAPVAQDGAVEAADGNADDKEDEGKISELQDMINKQMAALESLSGRLQVVLEKKFSYDGDVTITAQEREVADDFVLELVAKDVGTTGHEGAGYTIINGNLTIKGLKVEMKSVMMAAEKKITVTNDSEFASDRGSSLLYLGSENMNTKVSVEVGKLSSADIRMKGKDDGLELTVLDQAETVNVDMGEGLNEVNATLYGGDVTIKTGYGSDTVNVNVQQGNKSTVVTTGDDYDEVKITVDGNPETLNVDTGSSDDKIEVDVRAGAGDIYLNTGAGADTVNVTKGDHHTMESVDYSSNVNPYEVINDQSTAVLTIENADETAIDRITVDAAVSDAIKGIAVTGANGSAVHFKGTLREAEGNDAYNPMGWLAGGGFYLTGANGNRLEITGSEKNTYTDALENKKTVKLSASGAKYTYDAAKNGALQDFTNYAFVTPVSGLSSITFSPTRPLTLSNILLDTELTLDEDDHLKVPDITAVYNYEETVPKEGGAAGETEKVTRYDFSKGMNVLLKGQKIDIDGTILARNVRAQSVQGTTTIQQANYEQFGADTFMAGLYHKGQEAETPFDVINISHTAEINVGAGARIETAETVTLEARVKQVGSMSVLIPMYVNFLNWKMGTAKITIDGEIVTRRGSVTAEAKVQTNAGYRITPAEDGTMGIMEGGMPIAISVVLNEASVTLNEKAKITSASDVVLESRSEIKVSSYADNGIIKAAPFAVAFTWVDNQVNTKVLGDIDAGRRVLARSTGSVEDVTKAIRSSLNASPSSFYAAVNVVDQDAQSLIGGKAHVTAGGNVSVYSNAYADITTTARSTADRQAGDSSPVMSAIIKLLTSAVKSAANYIGPKVSDNYVTKKLEEKLQKIGGDSYSAKVINTGENADKGTATLVGTEQNGIISIGVNVAPNDGWGVKSVYYRYLEPGKTSYTWKRVTANEDNAYVFQMVDANIEVVVNYEQGAQVPAQVQGDGNNVNVNGLVNDAVNGANDVDAEGELATLKAIADDGPAYTLTYGAMKDGNVVTWLEADRGQRLTRVAPGQKILFMPNPDPGKQIKTLVIEYSQEVNGVIVLKKETIAPDDRGRYIFSAPEGLGNGAELTINATFETKSESQEESHSQMAGALAVSIVNSNDEALIEDNAQITTGGSIDMFDFRIATVNTLADGTEVGPLTPSSATPKEGEPYQTTKSKYSVNGAQYALRINSAQGGTVTYKEGVEKYHPQFTVTPAKGYYVEKAYVSYYTRLNTSFVNGKRTTASLNQRDGNVYEADLMSMPVVDGTTVDVTVVFAKIKDAIEYDDDVSTETTYVVRNPIRISYNTLVEKGPNNAQTITEIGTVNYVPILSGDGKYYITLHPDEEKGYIIDALDEDDTTQSNSDKGQLFASYIDASGVTRKIGLKRDADGWYLSLSGKGVPAGAVVTINAVFTEDLHELKAKKEEVDGKEVDHGTVTFSKEKAKATDKVTITAKPKEGYYATKVTVSWVESSYGVPKTKTKEYNLNAAGQVEITMPQVVSEGSLTVTPKFEEKTVTMTATGTLDGNTSDKNVKLSESGKGYRTEKIVVSPSDKLAAEGYKIASVTLHYYDADHQEKTVNLTNSGYEMSFKIPESIASMGSQGEALEITATLARKTIQVEEFSAEHGKVVPTSAYAELGETVTVDIKANEGYRIKAGTLKAEIVTATSTYQIVLKKNASGKYSFTMPGSSDVDQNSPVRFVGEFEPGSDGVEQTVGTGIAVAVVNVDSNVEIGDAHIQAEKGVSMLAVSVAGDVSTTSKSGYTQGDVGFAGAVTVHVASADVRTRIRANKTGGISLGNGDLFMLSKGRQKFEAVADASGDKKTESAESTGVGVGIAIAVNSIENIAEVEDGVKLGRVYLDKDGKIATRGANLTGVFIQATQWTTEAVTAKAGAAGGSAWVPAAAVDVTQIETRAKLGRMSPATLDLTDDVTIEAESTASTDSPTVHSITADASARGKGAAIGAAIAVDWVKNTVEATLNQSMSAPNVTIKATAGDTLKAKAKAAVSGGFKGKKDENSDKGSADKQADQLLGNASGIAAKSGARNLSPQEINQNANQRQAAETTEQSVAGAGALALNIQKNRSLAEVKDYVNLYVSGTLSVHSSNRTTAEIKADSSATKADTGVGVGVALNIVTIENIARIGNGVVTAGDLEVIADAAEMPKSTLTYLQVRDIGGFSNEIKQMIDKALSGWMQDQGMSKEWADSLSSLVGTAVGQFVSELIRDTEIGSLLDVAADGGIVGHLESFLNAYKERLTEDLPTIILQPFTNLYKEIKVMAGMDRDEYLELIEDIGKELVYQCSTIAFESGKSLVQNASADLIATALNIVSAKLNGDGFDKSSIKDVFKNSVMTELKKMGETMASDAFAKLTTRLTILSEDNIQYLKKLYKGGKDKLLENTVGSYLEYVSSAFREKIFDYEKYITMYAEGDLWDSLKTKLIAAAKQSQVTVTNEAIDMLTDKFDLKVEKQSKDGKHIVTTQAISGAGGKNESGAGSLAITVLNETTLARIADSENAVTVLNDGMLTVKAEEERRVRNIASAAVDKMGDADDNGGVGNTDKAETGTGADAKKKITKDNVVVISSVGATLTFDPSRADNEPRVWIDLDEGYKLPENGRATRKYLDVGGEEAEEQIEIWEEDGRYYIEPFDEDVNDYLQEHDVTIEIEFEEDLKYKISCLPEVLIDDGVTVPEGAVGVSVKDRAVVDNEIKTKAGDMVQIVAKRVEGYHVSGVRYRYEDENGAIQSVVSQVLASANENEAVFVFKMPKGNVTGIEVLYEEGEGEGAQDGAGRKIGVGASFALTYGNSTVEAQVGKRGTEGRYDTEEEADSEDIYGMMAGTVSVTASSKHQEYNNAVAGSDPLEGTDNDLQKDLGFDASVSINILDNDIRASVAEGTAIKTTAKPVKPAAAEGETTAPADDGTTAPATETGSATSVEGEEEYSAQDETRQDASEKKLQDMSYLGGVTVSASEESKNETLASAYATGSTTAVGASLAVNVSLSDIKTIVNAPVDASGAVHITASSQSEDNTWAFASAMGADVQRALNKFAKGVQATEDVANKLTKGEYFDNIGKKDNKTSKKVTDRLNQNQQQGGDQADPNLPGSVNVLRSQGVNTGDANDEEAQQEANNNVNNDGQNNNPGNQNLQGKTKWQIAAAVGFTWAAHDAAVTVKGPIDAGTGIEVTSTNHGNFVTRSTGVSMTAEAVKDGSAARSIAAAVAVSVDKNKATVDVKGDVVTEEGDVVLSSDLTQNMSKGYTGKLAAQALSLTLSGKGTGVSIAASIGLAISFAESTVNVAPLVKDSAWRIKGGAVHISATDKSRLGVRAGGVNLSRGSSVGAGISSSTIWSGDTVKATVADNVRIDADSLDLIARKSGITKKDFKYNFSWRDLVTDSSMLSPEDRENSHTGLIDVHRNPGEASYTVELNVNTYNVMKAIDLLNFATGVNYYTEAITGSVMMGGEENKLNLAGALSIVRAHNTVDAALGKNALVNLSGKMNIDAESGSNAQLVAGDVAAGKASNSWGIVGNFYENDDQVKAETGEGADIQSGSFRQNADANADVQNYNAAASIALGDNAKLAVGGAVNIILMKSVAENVVGDRAVIDAKGTFDLTSGSDHNLGTISVGIAGSGRAIAVGGTVAIIVNKAEASVAVGKNHSFSSDGDMNIAAKTVDHTASIIASASAALSQNGKSFAGALNVVVSKAKGNVTLDTGENFNTTRGEEIIKHVSGLTSRQGSVSVNGQADSSVTNVTVGVGVSKNTAIGLSINGSYFGREAKVTVNGGEKYVIGAARDVALTTSGDDMSIVVGAALAASVSEGGYSGNLMINNADSTFETKLLAGKVNAARNAKFSSHLEDHTYAIGGGLSLSFAKTGLGGATGLMFKGNDVTTDVGTSVITAGKKANLGPYEGVYVGATVKDTLVTGAAGIAYGTEHGISVNLLGVYNRNTIKATAEKAKITATRGGAKVEATSDTVERIIAGGLNFSMSTSGGGSIVGMYHEKNVDAIAGEITAARKIDVRADNKDDSLMLAVSAGVGKEFAGEVGIAVQVLKNKVHASAKADLNSKKDDIAITSTNTTELDNTAVTADGTLEYAGAPSFVVTWFEGETTAQADAAVKAAKGVKIHADGDKEVDQRTLGATVSINEYGIPISGAVTLLVAKDKVAAKAVEGTDVAASDGDIEISAQGDIDTMTLSGAIAGGGVGVSVNAAVGIIKDDVQALLAGQATASKEVNVKAYAERDMVDFSGSIDVGAVGAGGATIFGVFAGTEKISQDAIDTLVYGNSEKNEQSSSERQKSFDLQGALRLSREKGLDTTAINGLENELKGDDNRDSENTPVSIENATSVVDVIKDTVSLVEQVGDPDKKNKEEDRPKTTPEDVIIATIADTAVVTGSAVNVTAEQPTKADMYGGGIEAAYAIGSFGGSAAFVVMHSNVFATSQGTLNLNGGQVNVKASSTSGEVKVEDDDGEKARKKMLTDNAGDALLDGLNPFNRSIRAVSLNITGASDITGGASVAVVRADNVTGAVLGGKVNEASKVNVHGESLYKDILAATLSIGGSGGFTFSAGVAVAASDGELDSRIDGNLQLFNNTTATPTIGVTSHSMFKVNSAASSLAGGQGVINAAVSYAKNSLIQTTSIDRGAKIVTRGGAAKINVAATAESHTNAFLLPAAIAGGASANLSAGIANVKPVIRTGIGIIGNDVGRTVITAEDADVTVKNTVLSDQKSGAITVPGGYYAALGGMAMVTDNSTDSFARIANTELKANSLNVSSAVSAVGDSKAFNVGGALVGLAFANNTVDVHSTNLASIDTDNGSIVTKNGINVDTGDEDTSYTRATADGVSLVVGALTVGRINANAVNRSSNTARVTGKGKIDAGAGALNVSAYGKAEATSHVGGASIAGLALELGDESLAPLAKATNNATSHVIVKPGEALDNDLNVSSTMDAVTKAEMSNDGVHVISLEGAEAKAYGNASSLIDVELSKASSKKVALNAVNNGKDEVTADNGKTIFAAAALTLMDSIAESNDVFSTEVKLGNGDYRFSDLNITTDYNVDTKAVMQPSSLGVAVDLLEAENNDATSTNTAYANAKLNIAGGKVRVDKGVNIQTIGSATATAEGILPVFKLTVASGSSTDATAVLNAKQAAELELDSGELISYGKINVESLVNKGYSRAGVGAYGVEQPESGGFDINILFKGKFNTATAEEKMQSTAIIHSSNAETSKIQGTSLNMASGVSKTGSTEANASSAGNGEFTILLSVGDLKASGTVADQFHTVLDNITANIIGNASITAQGRGRAYGIAAAPPEVAFGANFTSSDVDAHVGTENEKQTVKVTIGDNVQMKSAGALEVAAKNYGFADAHYWGKGWTLVLHDVTGSQKTSSWYSTGVHVGKNANLTSYGGVDILADSFTQSKSDIHSEDAGFLINASDMYGDSEVTSDTNVDIGKGTIVNAVGDLSIQAKNSTHSTSISKYENYFSFWSKPNDDEIAIAKNNVTRNQTVFVDENAALASSGGAIRLTAMSGENDDIYTYAYGNEIGFHGDAKSLAEMHLTSTDRVVLQQGTKVAAAKNIDITALGGSYGVSTENHFGSRTEAVVKGGGAIVDPDATSKAYVKHTAEVDLNKGWNGAMATILSLYGDVNVTASNTNMRAYVRTNSDNNGGTGESDALSELHADLYNTIWADNTKITSKKTTMQAYNGAYAHVYSHAELYGLIAGVYSKSYMFGNQYNRIRSHKATGVTVTGEFVHDAKQPGKNQSFSYYLQTRRSGLLIVGTEKTDDSSSIGRGDDFSAQQSYASDSQEKPGAATSVIVRDAAAVLTASIGQATTILSDISKAISTVRKANAGVAEPQVGAASFDALEEAVEEILNRDIRQGDKI